MGMMIGKSQETRNVGTFGIRSRVIMSASLAGLLIIGCGGWAAQASLAGAAIAPGQIAVKRQVKEVQHRDGGIVAEIRVSNGDRVQEGDVLVKLDETDTRVELSIIRSQLAELTGVYSRLQAERDGQAEVAFPEGFDATGTTSGVIAGEIKLFLDNRAMRDSQKEQLSLQAEQLRDQIKGMEAQLASNQAEHTLLFDDITLMRKLLERKLTEGSRVRQMERELARIEGQRGEIESRVAQARGQISETELKILAIDQELKATAQTQIRDIDARIAELHEREIAAVDRLSRTELRAPASGLVYDLAVHTVGGVIGSGETILSLVPEDEEMMVEVRVSPTDIDQVTIGQPARLRLTAFNQRTTPEFEGQVTAMAAAATRDPASGRDFYLGTVEITSDLAPLGDKVLIPGMPVDVLLVTGERSALSYLVKPFTDQMAKAFREE
ncbi:HlyD family type I secretion periplasmic adaptor subunit [Rhizobium sp. EC-SD404]|uniref:HlyD family type I secretion periplasmic adaptor subunit n=1 Tax=Rhizobium sp. EC-SD404 TaxID=2038389 RepID=UPI0012552132|nr:HlyD family type I secretion periplasmic adaptor subunit [Rhizobium sp. EC-SD404]VVT08505.1 Type I secretion system membrane fusion protein PrsE [Rhizobium sp. EC-SD404]